MASGADHPLAPWRDAARGRVLESFQLLAVRRAPRGAAVVTVRERFWRARDWRAPLEAIRERVPGGAGRRRVAGGRSPAGTAFDDDAVTADYGGWFDAPAAAADPTARAARAAPVPARAWTPLRAPARP